MGSLLAKVRASLYRLTPKSRKPAQERPTALVWYIESRAATEQGAAPRDAVLGSGVVVRLERFDRTETVEGVRWTPKTPPDIRNYLLTCAHVVRHVLPSNSGWSPVLGEILCWKPGSPFQHWLYSERSRRTGEANQLGAHRAHVVLGRLTADAVSAELLTLWNDWILLAVEDGPTGVFDNSPAVQLWRELRPDDEGEFSVVGYPGGSSNWKHNERVTAHQSSGFRIKREDHTGALILSGPDETRPGMSGGGVFDGDGALVGLHRAATDLSMERHLVPIDHIHRWLRERGLRPPPTDDRELAGEGLIATWIAAVAVSALVLTILALGINSTARLISNLREPRPTPVSPVMFGTRILTNYVGDTTLRVVDPETGNSSVLTEGFDAVVSNDGRRIALSRYTAGYDTDIFTMNIDGTAVRPIVIGPGRDEHPTWSPDGTKIAFVTSRHGDYNNQIYIVNADGSGLVRLTNDSFNDFAPSWSPDGRKIAFHRYVPDLAGSEIFVIDLNGGGELQLTKNSVPDLSPAWSPDGTAIAFVRVTDESYELFTMSPSGRRVTRLTNNAFTEETPVWSPDGKRIAFVSDRGTPSSPSQGSDIYVMNADGSGTLPMTRDAAGYGRIWWFRRLP